MRVVLSVFMSLTLVLVGTGRAAAQVGWLQYNPRPAVSPYLNMLRGGNAAINYYGIIRPQLQTSATLQMLQLQQANLMLGQANASPSAQPLDFNALPLTTGHPVQFMNTSLYYPQPVGQAGSTGYVLPRSRYGRR